MNKYKNPTQPGILDRSRDILGGWVDEVFLIVPRLLKPFKPTRDIHPDTYARQIDFYFENGYIEKPETFFHFPARAPACTVLSEKPFQDGKKQIITFESSYHTRNPDIRDLYESFEANRTAWVVHWTHADPTERPTILCLHGYMLGDPDQAEKMFRVDTLYRKGFNVALFVTPFHWKRAPGQKTLRGIFLQPDDVVMTCECFGQAMTDLHQAIALLKAFGSKEIGLIGASLGGYLAGLYVGLGNTVSFAALMVPAVRLNRPFGPETAKLPFKPARDLKNKITAVWTLHSPLNFKPAISRDRILIIASRGDHLCPFDHVQALCEHWDRPRHRFLTGGHWLVFNGSERGRAWYGFLDDMRLFPEHQP